MSAPQEVRSLAFHYADEHELTQHHHRQQRPEEPFRDRDLREAGQDNEERDAQGGNDDAQHHVHQGQNLQLAAVSPYFDGLLPGQGVYRLLQHDGDVGAGAHAVHHLPQCPAQVVAGVVLSHLLEGFLFRVSCANFAYGLAEFLGKLAIAAFRHRLQGLEQTDTRLDFDEEGAQREDEVPVYLPHLPLDYDFRV